MGTADDRERLARMEAKIDHLLDRADRSEDFYDKMDDRLRSVEHSSAKHGAIFGTVTAVGVSILTSLVKLKGGA
jgi:hypothetical protein